MNKQTRQIALVISTAAMVLGGVAIATSPANASDVSDLTSPISQETVPLTFGGFNVARAAAYGYEIRTDPQGWQYAVPSGTPQDSQVGSSAKFNPKTGQLVRPGTTEPASRNDLFSPQNTVYGDCGSSTLTLYTKTSGYTSYNLDGDLGGAIYHTWKISLSASTGNQIVDRSGFPPYPGALNWGTNFTYGVHANGGVLINGIVSEGVVETVLGTCFSAGAHDYIYG